MLLLINKNDWYSTVQMKSKKMNFLHLEELKLNIYIIPKLITSCLVKCLQ